MLEENSGGIGAMLIKSFYVTPAGVLVDRGVLIEFLPGSFIDQAGGRNKLDVDLDPLSRIVHLLIRLRDILGIRRLDGQGSLTLQDAIEAGNGTLITTLHKFDPEDDEPRMGVPAAHIRDEFEFLRGMLVRMAVGTPGTVSEGFPGAVVPVHPTVDILPVDAVADCSLCDAMFLCVLN